MLVPVGQIWPLMVVVMISVPIKVVQGFSVVQVSGLGAADVTLL